MKNLNIGPRLVVAFGIILLVLAGIAVLGLQRLAGLHDQVELVVKQHYHKVQLGADAAGSVKRSSVSLRNLLIDESKDSAEKERANLARSDAEAKTKLNEYGSKLITSRGRQAYSVLVESQRQYELQESAYLELLAKGDREAAKKMLLGSLSERLEAYETHVSNLNKMGGALMLKASDDATETYETSRRFIAVLALIGIILAAGLSYWITRSITSPLNQAVGIARTIASGRLTSIVRVESKDETGRLLAALNTMNESLAKIVTEVRVNADVISNDAAEIAGGTLDLSSRTEEQASSLEESASSIEELTSVAKHSAATASGALVLAAEAATIAEKGGAEVAQVVNRMAAISESSRKIAEITSVIDGLAFQTNILALNAAVEAARAGEQGRGFAVVATEVRNLAQRSANAAREIKVLIEDSVEKILAGNSHAQQAGQTMDEVLAGIKRVASLMADIDLASREQSAGIEQINQAITQMDQVTQQNAALVEEAAAAADSMQRRTEALLASVQLFVVQDDSGVGTRPALRQLAFES